MDSKLRGLDDSTELLDCWEIKRLCNKERRTIDDNDFIHDEDYLDQMNSFKKTLDAATNQIEDNSSVSKIGSNISAKKCRGGRESKII